ncbi:hypothetical protein ACFYO0_05570 [Streptomyces sp. NPDC006365]|uniref:hypothetical protein n=1 Tax=Streptomyces sp. NPDC006365 TaxID=3364744 RepID=UPI0036D04A7E
MGLRQQLTSMNQEQADWEDVAQAARRLVACADAQELVARWHPLGFIDIPISEGAAAACRKSTHTTIHVWHPEFSRPQDPPDVCHSHGWHLDSVVLYGSFVNETYDVEADAAAPYTLYEVSYGAGVSISQSTGRRVTVRIENEERIQQGTRYQIPAEFFHWTRTNSDDLVITVMSSGGFTGKSPMTVRSADSRLTYEYERKFCSSGVRKTVFQDILSRLT